MKRPGFSLAPRDVVRWARIRASDGVGLMVRAGLPIGLVLAFVVDTVLLVVGGDIDLALSVWRLPRLALTMATLGPLLGAVSGQVIWERCERAFANHQLKEAFRGSGTQALPEESTS
jgi:hypothetical protein